MKRERLGEASVAELIDEYREAARRHGEATEGGDYKVSNKSADRIATIYSELRRRGPEAQSQLLRLLDDPAPAARLWAASHALEFAPQKGEAVLMRLVSAGRLLGLDAEVTLEEWRAGRLRFP